jgi:hypothetical protein
MSKATCFAHQHMTPAEYGFWQLCRDLSFKTGILYFDGRNMVNRFAGTRRNGLSKDYFYGMADTLTTKKWFELVTERKRGAGGRYTPSIYRVLSHEQFVSKHGAAHCTDAPEDDSPVVISPKTCRDNRTGADSPVGIEALTCRDSDPTCRDNGLSPVRLSRHNPIPEPDNVNLIPKPDAKPDERACRDSGTGVLSKAGSVPTGQPSVRPVVIVRQATSPVMPTGKIDWDAIAAKVQKAEKDNHQNG